MRRRPVIDNEKISEKGTHMGHAEQGGRNSRAASQPATAGAGRSARHGSEAGRRASGQARRLVRALRQVGAQLPIGATPMLAVATALAATLAPAAQAQTEAPGQTQPQAPTQAPTQTPTPVPSQAPTQAPTQAQQAIRFDIPAQSLYSALRAFSEQSGSQVLFEDEVVSGRQAPAIAGLLTPRQALQRLTQDAGLQINSQREGVFTIRPSAPAAAPRSSAGAVPEAVLAPVRVASQRLQDATTEGSRSYTAVAPTTGATRLGLTLRETPQSITVMTRERLDDQNISDLTEAMVQAPGVTVTTRGAYADIGYGIRGYAAALQRDGISVGSEESYTLLPSVDLEMYDRVEVVRGPSGLLEGSGGSIGGVINLVRRRPQAELGGTASVTIGSWNYLRTSASLTGALNADKTIRARALVVNHAQNFWYPVAEAHRTLAYGIVEADLGRRTLLTLSVSDGRADRTPFYGFSNNANEFSRSTFIGASWNRIRSTGNFDGLAELSHEFDNGWRLRGVVVNRRGDSEGQMAMAANINAATMRAGGVYGYKFERDDDSLGSEVQLSGPFSAWGQTHQLAVGGLWGRVSSDVGGASRVWNNVDLSDPQQLPVDAREFASVNDRRTETETTQSALFGVARLKLTEPLSLVLGGRFSNFSQRSRGRGLLNSSDWETSDARARYKFTPYGGLVWDLNDTLSWYASYVDIFVPQTAKDWQQKTLKPRNGWQVETGVKGEFFEGRLNASLALFRLRDTNRAMTDPDPAHMVCGDSADGFCSMAGGLQQSQGWEVELSGNLSPNWNIAASYTRTDSKVLRAADEASIGRRFYNGQPPHMFRLWTTYRFDERMLGGALDRWQIGGGIVAQSAQEQIDEYNDVRNAGFATYSLQAGYQISANLRSTLTIDNLFDRQYYANMGYGKLAAGTGSRWFYGSPRTVMLNVRGSF